MKKLLCFWLLLTFFITSYSQDQLGLIWQRRIGGSQNADWLRDVIPTSDGGFVSIGTAYSSNGDITGSYAPTSGAPDVWVTKLGATGKIIWSKAFGNYGWQEGVAVVEASDGGIVVAAITYTGGMDVPALNPTAAGQQLWVFKLNQSGNIVWTKGFGGNGNHSVSAISKVSGGYILTGQTSAAVGDIPGYHATGDAYLLKLNEQGDKVWAKAYGGSGEENGEDVLEEVNGNLVIVGYTNSKNGDVISNASDNRRGWVLKTTSTGDIIWSKVYGSIAVTDLSSIKKISTDTYIIGGQNGFNPYGYYSNDALLMKIDSAGNSLWEKTYGGSGWDWFQKVEIYNNAIVAFGSTNSNNGNVAGNHGLDDIWLVTTDSSGNLKGQRCFGGEQYEVIGGMSVLTNGQMIMCANTKSQKVEDDPINYPVKKGGWVLIVGQSSEIMGTAYVDINGNGSQDAGEPNFSGALAESERSNQVKYSSEVLNGKFKNVVDTGTYMTRLLLTTPYFTPVPNNRVTTFNSFYQKDSFSFRLIPTPNKQDLFSAIIPLDVARPGFLFKVKLVYGNKGTTTISTGNLRLIKDSRLVFVNSTVPYSTILQDTIQWAFTNYPLMKMDTMQLTFRIASPPTVSNGDSIILNSEVFPISGDETPVDNRFHLKMIAQGSYDPNDKRESHGETIDSADVFSGGYLNYTIRFQNMGTDTAFTISVRDTLDDKLDVTTLQMLSASHTYQLEALGGNKLIWRFANILLPDSIRNEQKSHGFINYRIKPKTSILASDIIRNRAAIYFDFNLPVSTNYATTTISARTLPVAYSFIGNGNWDNPDNWLNSSVAPEVLTSNMEITIAPVGGGECILNRTLTIQSGGKLTIKAGAVFKTLNIILQ